MKRKAQEETEKVLSQSSSSDDDDDKICGDCKKKTKLKCGYLDCPLYFCTNCGIQCSECRRIICLDCHHIKSGARVVFCVKCSKRQCQDCPENDIFCEEYIDEKGRPLDNTTDTFCNSCLVANNLFTTKHCSKCYVSIRRIDINKLHKDNNEPDGYISLECNNCKDLFCGFCYKTSFKEEQLLKVTEEPKLLCKRCSK